MMLEQLKNVLSGLSNSGAGSSIKGLAAGAAIAWGVSTAQALADQGLADAQAAAAQLDELEQLIAARRATLDRYTDATKEAIHAQRALFLSRLKLGQFDDDVRTRYRMMQADWRDPHDSSELYPPPAGDEEQHAGDIHEPAPPMTAEEPEPGDGARVSG